MSVEQEDFDLELISNLVHDLKTPIAAVKGFIDLIQQVGPLTDKQFHFSERALAGLGRMETMIINLLDYARIGSDAPLTLSECNLSELIDEALEILESNIAERELDLRVDIDPELQPILADERLIGHVFSNLLSNAIKYNVDKGIIWVTVSDEKQFVRVDVRDKGVGIRVEDQQRIFDRFYRAKFEKRVQIEGTGLGLSIARSIIDKHGGRIWVESKLNEGSTFSFILPRVEEADMVAQPHSKDAFQTPQPFDLSHREESSEYLDDVDDDLQESPEVQESDSRGDDY